MPRVFGCGREVFFIACLPPQDTLLCMFHRTAHISIYIVFSYTILSRTEEGDNEESWYLKTTLSF